MSYQDFLILVVYGLLTWRIASFLVYENGPFDVFAHVRDFIGVGYDEGSRCTGVKRIKVFAKMACCFKCSSVWIAWFLVATMMYIDDWRFYVIRVLVLSAIAIIANVYINGRGNPR